MTGRTGFGWKMIEVIEGINRVARIFDTNLFMSYDLLPLFFIAR